MIEESGGCGAEAPGFKITSFMEQQQALVKINEPRPDQIFFTAEHFAGFGEALERLNGFALLGVSGGFVGEGFRGFVTHAELFEAQETFVSHFAGFLAEVQLQINVGEIQMAEREVIGIADGFAGAAGGVEGFDGVAVFAAKIVEIGDVVIRLGHEERHVVFVTEGAGTLVGGKGAGKIVEADEADGHVAEDDGDAFRIFVRHQFAVRVFVVRDGFFEPILAVVNVADVDFKAGEAPAIVKARENFAGALDGLKGLVVFADEDQGLNGTAQCAAHFLPGAQGFVDLKGAVVMLDGSAMISSGIKCVGHSAQGQSVGFLAT